MVEQLSENLDKPLSYNYKLDPSFHALSSIHEIDHLPETAEIVTLLTRWHGTSLQCPIAKFSNPGEVH